MIRSLMAVCMAALLLLPCAATAAPDAPQQVLVMLQMPAPHFRPDGNYSGGYADAPGRSARRRIAAELARAHGLHMVTDWPMPLLGVDCFVMDVPAQMRPDEVASRLATDPMVAWAQVMNVFEPLAREGHEDPLFGMQPAAAQWRLAELHQWASGQGVRVAVIDSGIQADHPDLVQQISLKLNLVAIRPDAAELHGTAVAGIIAARADNHVGIAGVAPAARLLALRACWQASAADTMCTSLSLALALNAAIERDAHIINLSLGGPADRLIQRLVEAAMARGIAVVAAANRAQPDGGFPASLPGVIAVADAPLPRGNRVVNAPGTDILTTLPGSRWGPVSGASYAAAHVSGLLALMMDARSRHGPARGGTRAPVAADLVAGADGRIDACATLAQAGGPCGCSCAPATAIGSIARH